MDELCRGGLRIIQNSTAPRFSLDAVLLADFTPVKAGDSIVDLGCGTGILPLLLYAKNPDCRIQGIELMPEMADMARRSVAMNRLEQSIRIDHGDVRQIEKTVTKAAADTAVCNPPYYQPGKGKVSADALTAAARTEIHGVLSDFVAAAAFALKPLGCFYMIHRSVRFTETVVALESNGLRPFLWRQVQPFAGAEANLFLIAAVKGGVREMRLLPPLTVYESAGVYTREMREIYKGR
ncbi:MAG: tRNA1(Val) (adenine(37)-N6)-methyltransferase [Firmicutes bacterium]|nr:tRNA1(Val) (adenine(37)-N6)-methyltransferase [Bacillota bacterium]